LVAAAVKPMVTEQQSMVDQVEVVQMEPQVELEHQVKEMLVVLDLQALVVSLLAAVVVDSTLLAR
jgi:CHASE1-domain containing sensor protein